MRHSVNCLPVPCFNHVSAFITAPTGSAWRVGFALSPSEPLGHRTHPDHHHHGGGAFTAAGRADSTVSMSLTSDLGPARVLRTSPNSNMAKVNGIENQGTAAPKRMTLDCVTDSTAVTCSFMARLLCPS